MARIPSLEILKAAPQHAESLGSSGLAMLLAITAHWDSLGSAVAVCWSNSRLGERSGLSRNSISEVRSRLIKLGWLVYIQDGRNSGHYTPKLPEYHAQTSAMECANGVQFTVQTLCDDGAMTVQLSVRPLRSSLGSYIPIPVPDPVPDPIFTLADAPAAKPARKTPQAVGPTIATSNGPWSITVGAAKQRMATYGMTEAQMIGILERVAKHNTSLPAEKLPGAAAMHSILHAWFAKHSPGSAATEVAPRAPKLDPETYAFALAVQNEFFPKESA